MLSISNPIKSGSGGLYYTDLSNGKYYTEGGEPPGTWTGQGAKQLNLKGEVTPEVFRIILNGYSPEGIRLVENAIKEGKETKSIRQCGWDLTFSAPKSVSALWSQADKTLSTKLIALHESAVSKALKYLEDEAGYSRTGKGGTGRIKSELAIAKFTHHSSRAADPQIHTHSIVINVGVGADGKTRTIHSPLIFKNKMAAGALYRAEFSKLLEQQLGFKTIRNGNCFEIAGVSKQLMAEFSKRREEIVSKLQEVGHNGAKAAKIATLDTRGKKYHRPLSQLKKDWETIGVKLGFSKQEIAELQKPVLRELCKTEREAKISEAALAKLTAHESYFKKRDLVRALAENSQCTGIGAEDVIKLAEDVLCREQIVKLKEHDREQLYTTKEMLKIEETLITSIKTRSKNNNSVVSPTRTRQVIDEISHLGKELSSEQEVAMRHIVQNRDSVITITGMAGTGKSHLLSAVNEAFEQAGLKTVGACLTGKAAEGLSETGINSETISKTLWMLNHGKLSLTGNAVLIIDEAGMVGTRDLANLYRHVSDSGAKLVLVGDERQLQPVSAGGPFAKIQSIVGTVMLKEIRRQREDWSKAAVHAFAEGRAADGLKEYAARGLLEVSEDRVTAKELVVSEWSNYSDKADKNIILAGTNEEVGVLNVMAQGVRRRKGELGDQFLSHEGKRYYLGERILFTKNSRELGVKNGTLGEIVKINEKLKSMHVRLDNGEKVRVGLEYYSNIKHGYAITTHKSQGVTVERSFVLTGGVMTDRELSYVQVSRAKGVTKIYTDKLSAGDGIVELARQMSVSHQKDLAIDHLENQYLESEPYANNLEREQGDEQQDISEFKAKSLQETFSEQEREDQGQNFWKETIFPEHVELSGIEVFEILKNKNEEDHLRIDELLSRKKSLKSYIKNRYTESNIEKLVETNLIGERRDKLDNSLWNNSKTINEVQQELSNTWLFGFRRKKELSIKLSKLKKKEVILERELDNLIKSLKKPSAVVSADKIRGDIESEKEEMLQKVLGVEDEDISLRKKVSENAKLAEAFLEAVPNEKFLILKFGKEYEISGDIIKTVLEQNEQRNIQLEERKENEFKLKHKQKNSQSMGMDFER